MVMGSGEVIRLESRRRTALADDAIAEALGVQPPPRLAECIVHSTVEAGARTRRLLASCASIAIAFTLACVAAWIGRGDPMALASIDFVVDQEANAILASPRADAAALRAAKDRLGIEVAPQLGAVRYIGDCLFEGTPMHHLVATTPHGKVTILLMPQRPAGVLRSAAARGLHAEVFAAGSGSFVLIGDSARTVERAREMIVHRPARAA